MVVLNLKLESFSRMIREKLLELDFDRQRHVDQASTALAFGHRIDARRHEDALVDGLQPDVEIELRPLANGHETLTEGFANRHLESMLAHLARTVEEVAHVHAERRILNGHEG